MVIVQAFHWKLEGKPKYELFRRMLVGTSPSESGMRTVNERFCIAKI